MDWKRGPVIGRGSSATVFLASTAAGDLFAVKSAELSTSLFLQKEQQLLSQLRSPHLITYIGCDVDHVDNIPMYNLFMEYAPGGTISDIIKKQGGFLDESLIRSYTHQILLGLDYLHSNNLVHCDIKCQNLLIGNNGVKIGDLGCAKLTENGRVTVTDTSSVFSGTPVFMAPEVARGEEQGFAADIWAVGCAVIEMATGCNPWPEIKDPVSALYRIGYSDDVPLIPVTLSIEAKDFLDKCLRRNANERLTAKELLQHPFVNLNSCLKKMETFQNYSPSSILDQGLWDSFEVSYPYPSPKFTNFSSESPMDRVRQLVEAALVSSCLPNWIDEDDWITVRINPIDKTSKNSQTNLYADVDADADTDTDTDTDTEDDYSNESTRTNSGSFIEVYVEEEFRMMLESDVVESSGASYVSRFLDFKNMNINSSCLLIDSNSLHCIYSFLKNLATLVSNEYIFPILILSEIILSNGKPNAWFISLVHIQYIGCPLK